MNGPYIVRECEEWAAVAKPHGMPSAPLSESEEGTVLSWFLAIRPEARGVVGKKAIERGLIHRLDTATWGLVLIAKTQEGYDRLARAQESDLVRKRYVALCRESGSGKSAAPKLLGHADFPVTVRSRFRSWGPKGREVRPLFPGDRGYEDAPRDYATVVESVLPDSDDGGEKRVYRVTCALTRGHRHQIRAHLAYSGLPIVCDSIYGSPPDTGDLCLYAVEISFPSPADGRRETVLLPPPDRTIP